ncbi:MAG: hypothetical protein ACYC75_01415 [Minisyncoccota bacterium]
MKNKEGKMEFMPMKPVITASQEKPKDKEVKETEGQNETVTPAPSTAERISVLGLDVPFHIK